MIRLKNDVKPQDLFSLGFSPKYSPDTGEIVEYQKVREVFPPFGKIGLLIKKEKKTKISIVHNYYDYWVINPIEKYFDITTLFQLFKAGLVEEGGDDLKKWNINM